jgi:tetratricopeptide (TPR) repeat protein/tRNA A-37 threonylcarbamoyl transferase component Bud32
MPDSLIGQTVSHYRILEHVGEGGMGVVYLAEDTVLGRRVAIKTLHSRTGHDIQFRARFLREARAVSTLSHPHIATIYDYGETKDGEPYIVMEFIKGETLGDLILTEKVTVARAIEIIKQVAEALAEAHHHGIIHRDIKPTNVAINDRGHVKVLDFGLAKQVADQSSVSDPEQQTLLVTHTREGVIVGTPLYLSPEQAMGNDVDARSDLFSLGGLLYECIAGKPPFFGQSTADICAKVLRDDPPPPSTLNPDVPKQLDLVTLKCLAKAPDARYQSADEFVAALERIQMNLETDAANTVTRLIPATTPVRPSATIATISDIFRRPRLPVGYVALAAVALVVMALGAWYLARARAHTPNADALRLYETGSNAIRAGSFFQASKALELATRADDQFALAHARLAEAYMELDYFDRAKDEILRASELTPNRSVLSKVDDLYLDGLTATVRRNFTAAISAYSEIVKVNSAQAEGYVDLGRAYEKNNQSDKAIESYLEATRRDSQAAAAFLRLGILYGRRRDLNASGQAFDKAEEIYQSLGNVEGRTEVAFQKGVVLNDSIGKPDDARAQLEQARDMAKVVNAPYQQIRILFQLSSVALKQNKGSEAKQFATQALGLAQANQMETLVARGYIEMGNVDFVLADYVSAERDFLQGLDFAQKAGARLNEARAQLSLASLYEQRGEADRALTYQEPALIFYQSAGYRTETNQAMNIRARLYRRKGDFKSALAAFDDQLKFAEQNSDQAQVAAAHTSIGNLLIDLERYPEALQHLEQSYQIQKSVNNQLLIGYALLNRASAEWNLGHKQEAGSDFAEASEIAKRDDAGSKGLQVAIELDRAEIALAERQFHEAIAGVDRALGLGGSQNNAAIARGKYIKGLAQALSGDGRAGQALCNEAVATATTLGDPLLLARAQLALAQSSFAAGDSQSAISSAQQSRTFFSDAGLTGAEWRTWLVEGLVTERAGDKDKAKTCLNRAVELLVSLEQKWGAEIFKSYQDRPDVQIYRKQIDPNLSSNR